MPAFDSGTFDSGAFDAGDISATVSRYTNEVLAGYLDSLVYRYTAETLSAPIIWAADVTRSAAEVLFENIPYNLRVSRAAVEVLSDFVFELPDTALTVNRSTVEVLGYAASYVGKRAEIARVIAEALYTAAPKGRGLDLPSVSVDAASVFAAVTLNVAEGPGFLGMTAASGDGFRLTWPGGTDQITKTWRKGGVDTSTTFTYPGGLVLVDLTAPATGSSIALTSLSVDKPEGTLASGQFHELLVFNVAVSAGKRTQYLEYLTCKWLTPGCLERRTPCDRAPPGPGPSFTITSGVYESTYAGFLYPGLVGNPTQVGSYVPAGDLIAAVNVVPSDTYIIYLGTTTEDEGYTACNVTVNGTTYTAVPALFGLGVAGYVNIWGATFTGIPDLVDGQVWTVGFTT